MSIFGERLVKADNLFDGGPRIKRRTRDLLFGGFGAGKEKKIIDDSGESFAFRRGRFDDCAIFIRTAVASKSDLRFSEHVADWRAQLMSEIGGELRKASKGIFQTTEHVV